MSSLQRYKKSGGFVQLLSLIETFGQPKRDKFLEMIDQESKSWGAALREKMFSVDRIFSWPDQTAIEVLKSLPMKNMAVVLEGIKPEYKARMLVFFTASDKRRMDDELPDKPKPEEITANLIKLVESARKMISAHELRPDKFDEKLMIAEDIEAKLDAQAGQAFVDKMVDSGDAGENLVYNLPSAHPQGAGGQMSQHEIQQLQRTLAMMAKENKTLKDEVKVLRDKLDQIKKIA